VHSTSAGPVRLAADIGGTFTDLQIFDGRTATLASLKTPTTPEDPSIGLMIGIKQAARRYGFALADVGYLLHGTTIATNAVLERRLPAGALVTTANFEDVLEIGRHYRREVYAINPPAPPALVPRDRRIGIEERIRADGSVATALSDRALAKLVEQIAALDVATVAVCLVNSYRNPAHERRIAEELASALPHVRLSCSSELSPEIREYERTSTTVLNALLMPVIADYLDQLGRRMAQEQFFPTLLLVQSNGGMCSAATAAREPVRLLLSGPAGGAAACAQLAAALGADHLVGIDMGGTSFDVSVIRNGRVTLNMQGEVERLPVRLPMVEIRSIGAGGGSLAKVAAGGRLTIGPMSAGARPGPACYDRGGSEPTVTDANAALGRLDPENFLGGEMQLDVEAARAAIERHVAKPVGLAIDAAADGMLALTNANLGAAIRLSLFEKGLDPREFALAAFGGAAGLHALAVADELGVRRVIFPADAGTLSAFGILHSDLMHDLVRSQVVQVTDATVDLLAPLVRELLIEANASLDADAVAAGARAIELAVDMRYRGQAFELTVPMKQQRWDRNALGALVDDFHALHRQRFSYANPGGEVEIVSLRASAIGRLAAPAASMKAGNGRSRPREQRKVRLDGKWQEVAVWPRDAIASGHEIRGPAIIEEDYTTVLITPGWTCIRRADGHLTATRDPSPERGERAPERSEGGRVGTRSSFARPPSPCGGGIHIPAVELEIIYSAVVAAAAEMDVTVWRTSRSTIVRELLDYSTAVFDRDGWNVAQAARIPGHLNSMSHFLRAILDRFVPVEDWGPGDVVISNDPYSGGQHLPDIAAFKAVFHDGRRVGFVGTLCHHLDVGGSAPGSYGSSATEIFQEGLRIPPVKLVRAGRVEEDLRAMILQNVREPDILWGDLQSQLASLEVGAAGIDRLAAKLGPGRLEAAMAALLDGSEASMRDLIRSIPDGTYSFDDDIDGDGLGPDPIHLRAEMNVSGDAMMVDLSGCSGQALGPTNATLASTHSAVFYVLMAIASARAPIATNAGCYRPVRIVAPAGLVVSAQHPAPVVHRVLITHRLATVLFGALHQAVPDLVPAAYYAQSYVITLQTIDPERDRQVLVEIEVGGCGALADSDGASALAFGMHNNSNIPIEMIEQELPLTFLGYGLRPDSGGAGRKRGGLGLWREWRIECAHAQLTTNLDRFRFPPFGLAGGEPGALSALYLVRDGERRALASKITNMMLRRGDVIRLETSGGGGYGTAAARTREEVARDLRLGYISAKAAAGSYGV